MTKQELENYEPKGDLKGFPKEIIAYMLDYQEEQGNKRDISVFEKIIRASASFYGFTWNKTKEGYDFWNEVILKKDFNLFFEKYPKKYSQDNSQEFRAGDEVIDIMRGLRGRVVEKYAPNNSSFAIYVNFNNEKVGSFTLDGRYYSDDKYPRLLHYRDDYDYSIIDFNNLPKREEPKKWRAEEGGVYHFVNYNKEGCFFSDDSRDDYDYSFDNNNYNSGNYFSTEVEAEIIAQKLNSYFKQLIQEEHEHKKH